MIAGNGVRPPADERFSVIGVVGRGGYGCVSKAVDRSDGEIVALKRVRKFTANDSVPKSFYREDQCLRDPNLASKNIVKLKEVVRDGDELVLVLEYCEFDLRGLIYASSGLNIAQVRSYAKQLFSAVALMHEHGYVHRDLKPANVFVTRRNVVKLGDFGLSRIVDGHSRPLTKEVVTPSYRAPELLLGDRCYGQKVDVWSLGCVLFEMVTGTQMFATGTSCELAQLDRIFRVCGTPDYRTWPLWEQLPNADIVKGMACHSSVLDEILEATLPPQFAGAKELIASMLVLNPENRISIEDALRHPFFAKDDVLAPLMIKETHTGDIAVRAAHIVKAPARISMIRRVLPPPICA